MVTAGRTGKFVLQVAALADKATWAAAYEVLDRAGPLAVDDIVAGMSRPDGSDKKGRRVRKFCAALLDHNADARSVGALVGALKDADAGVRRLAVHAIGCQRCKHTPLDIDVVALLIDTINHDPSVKVRQVAAHMLGNQALNHGAADPRAIAALTHAAAVSSNAKLRSNANWSLAQHRAKEIQPTAARHSCERVSAL